MPKESANFRFYQTGISALDSDHLHLFQLINLLDRSKDPDLAMAICHAFDSHAKMEEDHMRSNNYPYIESHIRDHQKRVSELKSHISTLSTYNVWMRFTNHIEWFDLQYSEWLKNAKRN